MSRYVHENTTRNSGISRAIVGRTEHRPFGAQDRAHLVRERSDEERDAHAQPGEDADATRMVRDRHQEIERQNQEPGEERAEAGQCDVTALEVEPFGHHHAASTYSLQ
jgi:hypothetical protein